MSNKGPSNEENIVINNPIIKLAVEKIRSMPITNPLPNQINYKELFITLFINFDRATALESEKESALIESIESFIQSNHPDLKKYKTELTTLLNFLKTEQEKGLTTPSPEAPIKGILKKEKRQKALSQLFDLANNKETYYELEEGKKLNYSTKEFRESERQKYQAKRTPNAKGEVQLKVYGENPPLSPEVQPFNGEWLSRSSLQEVENYFEELGDFEAVNISRNQDGTYEFKAFVENEEYPSKTTYTKNEMNDILLGYRFQKSIADILQGEERAAKFRYYTRSYLEVLDLYSPSKHEIACMIAALRSLNVQISNSEKYSGVERLYIDMEEIVKVLNEYPRSLLAKLKEAYQQALISVVPDATTDHNDMNLSDSETDSDFSDFDAESDSDFSDFDAESDSEADAENLELYDVDGENKSDPNDDDPQPRSKPFSKR